MAPTDCTAHTVAAGRPAREVWGSERGVALLIALMSILLLTALGMALLLTTMTETSIAGNYRNTEGGLYAADAGLERSMQDLLTIPNWNQVLAGGIRSAFVDGPASGTRQLPSGGTLDLSQVVNVANCGHVASCTVAEMNTSTLDRPWGTNNPRYQLYAYGEMNDLVPTGTIDSPYYVVVLVADDPAETDGDPLTDANGVVAFRVEAFGPSGTHKVVEATLARTDSSLLERGYTGQRGQDEQNRRARKAALQTPGGKLTRSEMSISSGILGVK